MPSPLTDPTAAFLAASRPDARPGASPDACGLPDVPIPLWRGAGGFRDGFNRAWLSWTGRSLGDEAGEGWLAGVHPDDRERCRAAYAAPDGGDASREVSVEYRLRRADGAYRWVRDTARLAAEPDSGPGPSPDGPSPGPPPGPWLGACADIHDGKIAAGLLAEAERTIRNRDALLRETQHRARNNVQVTLSLLNLYGRAVPEVAAGLFASLSQRVRAVGIVGGGLPEGPDAGAVDLTDYLQQVASQLAGLYGTEGPVSVEGARAAFSPPRAYATGMVITELLGSLLRPAERAREGVRVEIGAPAGGSLRIRLSGESAPETNAPPRLGERLTAAYAARAGIEITRTEGLIELVVPVG